jgi:hypothetical protein
MSMDFDAIDLRVELALGADLEADPDTWTWTDLADPANGVDGIHARLESQAVTVKRGAQDETSSSQPAAVSVVLDNRDGALTPGNPSSPWWPNVKRGTPMRVCVATDRTAIVDTFASTPDHASLDITGDIDLRWDGVADWSGVAGGSDLIVKNGGAGQLSYWLTLTADGELRLRWSELGTIIEEVLATELVAIGRDRLAVRATLEVDDGDGGHVVRFYTAPTIDADRWRPLGDPITTAGTTSIFSSTGSTGVGSFTTTTYAAEIRNGIDGTIVARPEFSLELEGTDSFVDAPGRTWTVFGSDEVSSLASTRFIGNVVEILPQWPAGDISTDDDPGESIVQISGAGVLRRLGRRGAPTGSLLRRAIRALGPVAYWPLEDPSSSTVGASGLEAGRSMSVAGANFAGATVAPGSDPVIVGDASLISTSGIVGPATAGAWSASYLYLPDGQTNEIVSLYVHTTGTARLIAITINAPSSLIGIDAFTAGGSLIDSSSWAIGSDVFAGPTWLHFDAVQDGSAIDVGWQIENVDGAAGGAADTFAGCTCGRITRVQLVGANAEGWGFGHIFTTAGPLSAVVGLPAGGFAGEDGTARLERLAAEAGLELAVHTPLVAERMGAQPSGQVLELMAEVAAADLGILTEQIERIGLYYRPRASLYTQEPRLELDATAGEITLPFTPVLDDSRLVNEVELTQTNGPTVTATGDQSEGIYDVGVTVNVDHSSQLAPSAAWRLHLGTYGDMRVPVLSIDLAQAPAWVEAWCDLRQGDLVRVVNLPPQYPPGPLELIVQGSTEAITSVSWDVELNCSPGAPWVVGIFEDEILGRLDSDASELDADIDATTTSIDVAISDGLLWSHADGDFDIEVGGEHMTVTAISGASSPQTFTVVRSVNDVEKSHEAGAAVRLAHPLVLAW